jgi:hypothetical protein
MPRYFFHMKDEAATMLDHEGIELDDLEEVREKATQSARQCMSERVLDGHATQWAPNGREFVVTDEEGQVVLLFPFKRAISD